MGNGLTSLFGGTNSKESKKAQADRLQVAEGTLDALSRSQAVIEFDMDGTILNANENFLSVMGYRLDEVQGQHHSLFVDATQKTSSEYSQFWQRLGRGEFMASEFKRSAKGGRDVWIQASYNPILDSDGRPYRVIKFATDITEQRLLNANYAGQLAAIGKSNAVIEFNLDGTILSANDNFLQTMGYQFSEIQGKPHKIFVESDYANSNNYRQFWDALRRGEYQAGEFKRIDKGGQEVWIQASYNPIMDASGNPFKVVKYASNITEQKQLQQTIEAALTETKNTMAAIAQGDLTARMNGEFIGQFAILQDSVNECVDRMHSTLSEIRSVANGVTTESAEIVDGTSNLSERTVMQAANLEETAASMEEITTTVKGNAANALTANDLAVSASEQAKLGVGIVRDAVRAMDGLNESSGKISEIIGVINDIAFQTNLLALNASVEAARAGSQGRGFAVVASEVRDLAGRSATAAKEIKELIEDSANRVSESSELVNKSGASLNDIVAGVEEVSTVIGHISTASGEQSLGVSLVNNAITQIDELTQQNGSLVEQATLASKNLNGQATELARLVATFRLHDSIEQPRQIYSAASDASNSSSMVSLKRA